MDRIGKYSITATVGIGAYGVVFKATDTDLDRIVALKSIKSLTNKEVDQKRFVREAKALAKLSHPNIVTLYDLIEHEDDLFLVMQYIDGIPLSVFLDHGPMPLTTALDIISRMTSALVTAHGLGIMHGDIKPANIMIDTNDVPYLVDFGLAKFWREVDPLHTILASTKELTTSLDGTLPYMAPEKIMGQISDDRADIFSLGTVFYEMLTGRRAFEGNIQGAVLNRVLNDHPTPIQDVRPEVPSWLAGIIEHMLEKDPGMRIRSMLKVQIELGVKKEWDWPTIIRGRIHRIRTKIRRQGGFLAAIKLVIAAIALAIVVGAGIITFDYVAQPVSVRMEKAIDLVRHFEKDGAVEESKELFSSILIDEPDHAGAEAGMAMALVREYTSKESDPATLRRATALAESALQRDPQLALANIAAAWAAEFNGDFDRADRLYNDANLLAPDSALILEGRARLLKKRGDFAAAGKVLQSAIKLHPDDRIFYDGFGEILFLHGKYREAERQFRQGLYVAPDNVQGYANLAQTLHMQGKTREAIRTIQDGLKIRKNTNLYNNLGTYLFFQGQYEQAAQAFERMLKLDGNSHDYLAWANLADAQRYIPHKSQDAKASYERAVQLLLVDLKKRPNHEGLNSRLALYAAKAGDFETARDALLIATGKAVKDPRTFYRIMVVHEIMGDRTSALEMMGRALKAGYPLNEIANDPDLARLRQDRVYQMIISKWESGK